MNCHNMSLRKSLRKQNIFNSKANVLDLWPLLRGHSKFIKLLVQQVFISHHDLPGGELGRGGQVLNERDPEPSLVELAVEGRFETNTHWQIFIITNALKCYEGNKVSLSCIPSLVKINNKNILQLQQQKQIIIDWVA